MKGRRQRTSAPPDVLDARSGVYTVAQLNRETRALLNEHYGRIWVQGEISNLALPSSGHCYFTLRDAEAQVRCAMFRSQNRSLAVVPQNGDQVLVQAQVSLYEPRGDYQLIVEYLEPVGDGLLRRAFEILKQRLAAEGLFDAAHKKPIPALPRTVGVITSPTGAAIHDILTVLRRRFPAIAVIIFPTKVQGEEAREEIVAALEAADRSGLCDVLLLARGGGSLEDLWPFNEELVARALCRCRTPVVTGIGHEIDFTIADWVADLRAATPSAAAEAVSPDARDWLLRFQQRETELRRRFAALLQRRGQQLAHLEKRLGQAHPVKRIATQRQRVDELELRLRRAVDVWLAGRRGRLDGQTHRLLRHHPKSTLELHAAGLAALQRRLLRDVRHGLEVRRAHLQFLEGRLALVGPQATLERGYAVLTRASDGALVTNAADLAPGDATRTLLARGAVLSRVEASQPEPGTTG